MNKIWTPLQIGVASFVAGPLGGCYFMGDNLKTLGNQNSFKNMLWIGIGGNLALILLTLFISPYIPTQVITMAYVVALFTYAKQTQGETIARFLREGGVRGSWLRLGLISALLLMGLVAFVFGWVFLLSLIGIDV